METSVWTISGHLILVIDLTDVVSNKWSSVVTTGENPGPRCAHTCSAIDDGKQLVLIGGMSVASGKQTVYSDIYLLDLGIHYFMVETFVWKKSFKEVGQRVLDHASCLTDSNSIIVHGGMSFEHVYQDAQMIDLADL